MHPTKLLKVPSRAMQRRTWAKTALSRLQEQLRILPIVWGENSFEGQTVKEMKLSWQQLKRELFSAQDTTLMLAVIAGFAAWIITQLLRVVLG